jgi:hypothetical protein
MAGRHYLRGVKIVARHTRNPLGLLLLTNFMGLAQLSNQDASPEIGPPREPKN